MTRDKFFDLKQTKRMTVVTLVGNNVMKKDIIYTDKTDEEIYYFLCDVKTKEEAFRALYARHKARIYGYCRKIVGTAAADDMLQETFLRFLTSAHRDKPMNHVLGYLMTIARNLCLNYKENHERQNVHIEDVNEIPMPTSVESMHTSHDLKKAIDSALDLLQDEYREAVWLQIYSGMSYQEIAETTGNPVSTVRNRIVRAKTKLRGLLAPYFEELKD